MMTAIAEAATGSPWPICPYAFPANDAAIPIKEQLKNIWHSSQRRDKRRSQVRLIMTVLYYNAIGNER